MSEADADAESRLGRLTRTVFLNTRQWLILAENSSLESMSELRAIFEASRGSDLESTTDV
jgi:hypothetical protein